MARDTTTSIYYILINIADIHIPWKSKRPGFFSETSTYHKPAHVSQLSSIKNGHGQRHPEYFP